MGDEAPVAARVAPPRRRCAAVALCALLSGPAAHAQSPAVLADARAALKAGRADRALALTAGATTPEGLRLKILAAADAHRLDVALDAYAARFALAPAHDSALLRAIADAALAQSSPADPQRAAIARCERTVAGNTDPEAPRRSPTTSACLADMAAIADDATAPTATRASAALVLVRGGDRRAGARVTALAVTPHAAERRALLPVLQRAPAGVALPVLMAFLDDGDLGIEHAAAAAMAAFPTDEAKQSLRGYLAINFRRIARAPAVVSLAAMGDAQAQRELRGLLPQLTGMDLVRGASVLVTINDPRGVTALEGAAQGQDELVRAHAGATLAAARPAMARAVLERGLGHASVQVRLLTLDAFASTTLLDETRLLALLRDRDASIRTRAAELLWRR
ncbi:MAG: hypothetical protein JNM38_17175 [Acidobacteria bacterium]|nr:hypothetical protein [Acidobacteriota bacterium]